MSNITVANDPPVSSAVLLNVGPVFIGILLNWTLLGISTVQLYLYHTHFKNDQMWMRAMVFFVYAFNIFHSISVAYFGWFYFCAGWGRPSALIAPNWTYPVICFGDSLTGFIVQAFYSWRIWKLTRSITLVGVIVAVAVTSFIFGMLNTHGAAIITSIAGLHADFVNTIVWLGAGALSDIVIAIVMVVILSGAKKNANSAGRQGNNPINRLIEITVETGAATAVTAIMVLILFLVFPTTNLQSLVSFPLSLLYSNSLYTSLNSRIAANGFDSSPSTASQRSITGTTASNVYLPRRSVGPGALYGNNLAPVTVSVTQKSEVFYDGESGSKSPRALKFMSHQDDIELGHGVGHAQ